MEGRGNKSMGHHLFLPLPSVLFYLPRKKLCQLKLCWMESAHEFPFLLRNWELKSDYQFMETKNKRPVSSSHKKILMLGKTEGRRRRGRERMRWLDGITDWMDMSLSKVQGDSEGQRSLACCSPWGCWVGHDEWQSNNNASKLELSGGLSNLFQLEFSSLYNIIKYKPFLAFLKYCCKDQACFYYQKKWKLKWWHAIF